MATTTRVTAEGLWRMGTTEDLRRELVDGEVVETAPTGGVHGLAIVRVSSRLAVHVDEHGGGLVVAGDVGFVLALPWDPERVRAPDVAFIGTGRLPDGRLPPGFIRGAPDLAVEVLSPSDNPLDVQQKVQDWLAAGARLVWVIAPQARSATVYRPDGSARLVRERETLDGEDVLPGLHIPLEALFR